MPSANTPHPSPGARSRDRPLDRMVAALGASALAFACGGPAFRIERLAPLSGERGPLVSVELSPAGEELPPEAAEAGVVGLRLEVRALSPGLLRLPVPLDVRLLDRAGEELARALSPEEAADLAVRHAAARGRPVAPALIAERLSTLALPAQVPAGEARAGLLYLAPSPPSPAPGVSGNRLAASGGRLPDRASREEGAPSWWLRPSGFAAADLTGLLLVVRVEGADGTPWELGGFVARPKR